MQLYFNSAASGGDNNNDFGDINNFWQDSSWTIPNGNLPTTSDNVQLDDSVTTCTNAVGLDNLTAGAGSSFNGGTVDIITINGSATGIVFEGGNIATTTGTLNATDCEFTYSPAFAINGSSGCIYAANLANNITDDGTGIWGNNFGYTFSGTIISAGTIASEGCTFSGSVTAQTITIDQTNTSGSSFTGAVIVQTITSPTANFTNSFSSSVTMVGAASLASCILTGNLAFSSNVTSITIGTNVSLNISNISALTVTFATPSELNSGQSTGSVNSGSTGTGTLVLPSVGNVKLGVVYGIGGNGSTGTLASSGGTVGYVG